MENAICPVCLMNPCLCDSNFADSPGHTKQTEEKGEGDMVLEGQRNKPQPVHVRLQDDEDAHVIKRAAFVPNDAVLISTYVGSQQLVYVFRGTGLNTWYEYNYTTGEWFKYRID